MATTFGNIFAENFDVTNVITKIFTVPSTLLNSVFDYATVTNYSDTAEVLTVYIVPSGGSADLLAKAIVTQSVAPGATNKLSALVARAMFTGGSIHVLAGSNLKLSFSAGGSQTST